MSRGIGVGLTAVLTAAVLTSAIVAPAQASSKGRRNTAAALAGVAAYNILKGKTSAGVAAGAGAAYAYKRYKDARDDERRYDRYDYRRGRYDSRDDDRRYDSRDYDRRDSYRDRDVDWRRDRGSDYRYDDRVSDRDRDYYRDVDRGECRDDRTGIYNSRGRTYDTRDSYRYSNRRAGKH